MKQVASFRQYHAAYSGGHWYVWNVMLGRAVGAGGLGFGVVRDEHASATKHQCLLVEFYATAPDNVCTSTGGRLLQWAAFVHGKNGFLMFLIAATPYFLFNT